MVHNVETQEENLGSSEPAPTNTTAESLTNTTTASPWLRCSWQVRLFNRKIYYCGSRIQRQFWVISLVDSCRSFASTFSIITLNRRRSIVCLYQIYGYSDNTMEGPGDVKILAHIERSRALNQPCLSIVEDDIMIRVVFAWIQVEQHVGWIYFEPTALAM